MTRIFNSETKKYDKKERDVSINSKEEYFCDIDTNKNGNMLVNGEDMENFCSQNTYNSEDWFSRKKNSSFRLKGVDSGIENAYMDRRTIEENISEFDNIAGKKDFDNDFYDRKSCPNEHSYTEDYYQKENVNEYGTVNGQFFNEKLKGRNEVYDTSSYVNGLNSDRMQSEICNEYEYSGFGTNNDCAENNLLYCKDDFKINQMRLDTERIINRGGEEEKNNLYQIKNENELYSGDRRMYYNGDSFTYNDGGYSEDKDIVFNINDGSYYNNLFTPRIDNVFQTPNSADNYNKENTFENDEHFNENNPESFDSNNIKFYNDKLNRCQYQKGNYELDYLNKNIDFADEFYKNEGYQIEDYGASLNFSNLENKTSKQADAEIISSVAVNDFENNILSKEIDDFYCKDGVNENYKKIWDVKNHYEKNFNQSDLNKKSIYENNKNSFLNKKLLLRNDSCKENSFESNYNPSDINKKVMDSNYDGNSYFSFREAYSSNPLDNNKTGDSVENKNDIYDENKKLGNFNNNDILNEEKNNNNESYDHVLNQNNYKNGAYLEIENKKSSEKTDKIKLKNEKKSNNTKKKSNSKIDSVNSLKDEVISIDTNKKQKKVVKASKRVMKKTPYSNNITRIYMPNSSKKSLNLKSLKVKNSKSIQDTQQKVSYESKKEGKNKINGLSGQSSCLYNHSSPQNFENKKNSLTNTPLLSYQNNTINNKQLKKHYLSNDLRRLTDTQNNNNIFKYNYNTPNKELYGNYYNQCLNDEYRLKKMENNPMVYNQEILHNFDFSQSPINYSGVYQNENDYFFDQKFDDLDNDPGADFIYQCDPCMKKFKRLSTLKIHIFSHLKAAFIYACPKPKCSSGFKSQSIALKHILIYHSDEKEALSESLKRNKYVSVFRSYTTLLDYFKTFLPKTENPFTSNFCFGCFTYPRSMPDHPCTKIFYSLTVCPSCKSDVPYGKLEEHVFTSDCQRALPLIKEQETKIKTKKK